jgi:hypothetical protein
MDAATCVMIVLLATRANNVKKHFAVSLNVTNVRRSSVTSVLNTV